MAEQIRVLIVHPRDEAFEDLVSVLYRLDMEVVHARNCREANSLFKGEKSVDLLMTGADLPDGSWEDMLVLAAQSKSYLPVIVVSKMVDIELYLEALGSGAFDFITPPFQASDLAHIIRSAIYKELVSVKQSMSIQQAV